MRDSIVYGLIITGLAVMMVSTATAQSADDPQTAETGKSVNAGTVENYDVSVTTSTDDWSGLYGQIQTEKTLESSNSMFYKWTAGNPDSMKYVYAVTSGNGAPSSSVQAVSDPSTVVTGDGGADSASNTYSTNRDFTGLGYDGSPLNTKSVQTFDSSGSGAWTTYLLNDGSGNPVFAAEANADSDSFNGNSVDYQMLLPSGSSMNTGSTYDFYVELE